MGWGDRYYRNGEIASRIPRKYDEKSLKRTHWFNTMTYVDTEGHRWYRLRHQDLVKIDRSGQFANIYWSTGVPDYSELYRIRQILKHHFPEGRNGLHFYRIRKDAVTIQLDSGSPDTRRRSSRNSYHDTVWLHYEAYRGMKVPGKGLLPYQGYENVWQTKRELDDWARRICKHGTRTQKKLTKWADHPSCPECKSEFMRFDAAWEVDTREGSHTRYELIPNHDKIEKVWDTLRFYNADPFGMTIPGDLPFSQYAAEGSSSYNHHLFRHLERGEYPPELIAAAMRSGLTNNDWIRYNEGKKEGLQILNSGTAFLRWAVRSYLVTRLGMPVYRI